jgi:hypothetical protein
VAPELEIIHAARIIFLLVNHVVRILVVYTDLVMALIGEGIIGKIDRLTHPSKGLVVFRIYFLA